MDKITQLEQEARRLGKKAEDGGDLRAAMAVHELVSIVEFFVGGDFWGDQRPAAVDNPGQ